MSVKAILTDQQRSYTKAEEDALLAQKQDTLTFDNEPISGSSNPVKSSGIKTSIDNVINGVTSVALAENLTSDSAQSSADTFIERTTGGTASLSDGDGWIQIVRGSHIHTGYVPSDVDMTVTPVLHTLTGTIDQATFFAAVGDDSGTKTFTYTTNWDYNPVTYGITLTGTPLAGDQIVVTYDTNSAVSMTVLPIYHSISAEIDEDTFLSEMSNASGYMEFTYTTNWDYDPATYGITITGSPISGDKIRVDYIKETRGTITQSNPQSFKSSGWNLYNHTNGYARVLKYSETYGFGIAGTYTSLAFSSTISGAQSAVTVTNGRFTIPEDGYIFVTGGNNTDTQIWMTWSDWTSQANGGTWEAYTESTVDFSSVMSSYFPYGLLEVGTYQDEINFSSGVATNKVARIDYSLANLANVKAMGVDYEYDENYIYYGLSTPITNSISVDNSVDAYDHGMEWFTETALAVYAQTIYGRNLKNKLERDVLTISQQDLTNSDIAQVKENLKISYMCNENLLRNWYFVGEGTGRGVFPVNSRGKSSYSASGLTYTIDGWYLRNTSAGISLTSTGLNMLKQTVNYCDLGQQLSQSTLDVLVGKVVTISWFDGITCDYATYTWNGTTTPLVYSKDGFNVYSGYNVPHQYNIVLQTTLSQKTLQAVKLELGNQQTLCHQENGVWVLNEVPDYEQELLRCQTSTADPVDTYANKVVNVNIPNKNLLQNWYFLGTGAGRGGFPINSRGQTQYDNSSSSGLYCIDSWRNARSKVWLTAPGLAFAVSGSGNTNGFFTQTIDVNSFLGKMVTCSILMSSPGSPNTIKLFSLSVQIPATLPSSTQAIASGVYFDTTDTTSWLTLELNSSGILTFGIYQSVTVASQGRYYKAVKLELGTEQTLCHQEKGVWVLNEIPDYEAEYYHCITSDVDSTDTYANQKVSNITVQCNSVGSTSLTYYNSLIQSTHKVLDSTLSNPAAQTGDITVTTYNGYLTFSNNFASGATTNITLVLGTSGPVLTTTTTAPS